MPEAAQPPVLIFELLEKGVVARTERRVDLGVAKLGAPADAE